MASGTSRGLLAACAIIVHIGCNEAQVSLPFQCSFESDDICGMTQMTDDQFDWTRHNGTTPSAFTGPSEALDGDYYIYIEASYYTNGERAVIETPPLRYSGAICVQFWYHMYTLTPSHMGRLVVFTERQGEGNPLFNVSGVNRGDQWITERITVKEFNNNDKIVFLNEERNRHQGDMALDMIDIQGGTCNACSLNNGGCDTHCATDGGGRRCECDVGYQLDGDGVRCFDIDECAANGGKGDCDHQCDNAPGWYRCDCDSGYTLNGNQKSCDDINECSANGGKGPCDVTCENNPGSYMCSCPDDQYLQRDGTTCADETSSPTTTTTTTSPPNKCLADQACDVSSFPLWQLLTGVFVGAAALGAIIAVVTVCIRKRISSGEGEGHTPYENAEEIIRHKTRAANTGTQSEGGVYDEVFAPDVQTTRDPNVVRRHETTAQNTERQAEDGVYDDALTPYVQTTRGPNDVIVYNNAAFHGDGPYQELGPTDPRTSTVYQGIN